MARVAARQGARRDWQSLVPESERLTGDQAAEAGVVELPRELRTGVKLEEVDEDLPVDSGDIPETSRQSSVRRRVSRIGRGRRTTHGRFMRRAAGQRDAPNPLTLAALAGMAHGRAARRLVGPHARRGRRQPRVVFATRPRRHRATRQQAAGDNDGPPALNTRLQMLRRARNRTQRVTEGRTRPRTTAPATPVPTTDQPHAHQLPQAAVRPFLRILETLFNAVPPPPPPPQQPNGPSAGTNSDAADTNSNAAGINSDVASMNSDAVGPDPDPTGSNSIVADRNTNPTTVNTESNVADTNTEFVASTNSDEAGSNIGVALSDTNSALAGINSAAGTEMLSDQDSMGLTDTSADSTDTLSDEQAHSANNNIITDGSPDTQTTAPPVTNPATSAASPAATTAASVASPAVGSIQLDSAAAIRYLTELLEQPDIGEFVSAGPSFNSLFGKPKRKVEKATNDVSFTPTTPGIHLQCCGHFIHRECLQRYLQSQVQAGSRPNTTLMFMPTAATNVVPTAGTNVVQPTAGTNVVPIAPLNAFPNPFTHPPATNVVPDEVTNAGGSNDVSAAVNGGGTNASSNDESVTAAPAPINASPSRG
eukprot:682663_1